MKKLLLFTLFILLITLYSFAQQLPNASFEIWNGTGNNEKPDDWNQLNASLPSSVAIFVPKTCHKETNPHSGTYCAKLETVNVTFQGAVNGILTTGDIITSPPYGVENGLPYPYRPDSLVGWYKTQPASGDRGTVEITLLDVNLDTVGRGKFFAPTSAVNTWTRFAVKIDYFMSGLPDKAITLSSSSDGFNAVVGSLLWVDDLSLVFNPASITESDLNSISVYSNNGFIYVNLLDKKIDNSTIEIYSIDGKLINVQNLNANSLNELKLENEKGIYIYSIVIEGKNIISGKLFL